MIPILNGPECSLPALGQRIANRRCRPRRGFTLIELLVVIAIIAILVALLVPGLRAADRYVKMMKNGTQQRGILQSFLVWSQKKTAGMWFPKDNIPSPPALSNADFGGAPAGNRNNVAERFNALLSDSEFPLAPKIMLNPYSQTDMLPERTPNMGVYTVAGSSSDNCIFARFSYVLLTATNGEWKNLTHATAPLIADKCGTAGDAANGGNYTLSDVSAWNNSGWIGDVGWGDIHVSFEKKRVVSTVMNGNNYPSDDLFNDDSGQAANQGDTLMTKLPFYGEFWAN